MSRIHGYIRSGMYVVASGLRRHWRDGNGTRKVQADGSRVSHAWRVISQVAPGRSDPLGGQSRVMSRIHRSIRSGMYVVASGLRRHWRDARGTRKVQADGSRVSHAWRVMSQVAPGRSDPLGGQWRVMSGIHRYIRSGM